MLFHLGAKEKLAYVAIGCLVFLGLGYLGAQRLRPPATITFQTDPQPAPAPQPPPVAPLVTVHIVGQVARPGVYKLGPEQRWGDAIAAAGGALQDADTDRINLAKRVTDGEQIRVPRIGENIALPAPTPTEAPAKSTRSQRPPPPERSIDLNTATIEDLEQIPGIGRATATRILELRTAKGRFVDVGQLREIKGMSGKRLENLRRYLVP